MNRYKYPKNAGVEEWSDNGDSDEEREVLPTFIGRHQVEGNPGSVLDWQVHVSKNILPPKNAKTRLVKNQLHVKNLVPTSLAVTAPERRNPRTLPPIKGVRTQRPLGSQEVTGERHGIKASGVEAAPKPFSELSVSEKQELNFQKSISPPRAMINPTKSVDLPYLHRDFPTPDPSWLTRNAIEEEAKRKAAMKKKEKVVLAYVRYEQRIKEGLEALHASEETSVDLQSMGSAVMAAHSRSYLPPVMKRSKTSFR